MTTGVVLSVDVERYGDTLTAATVATDLVLQVDNVNDFADEDDFAAGPQWLTVGDSTPMQYVSVDDDAQTVTLASAVGAVYESGEPVRMWDPTIGTDGAEVVGYVCWVELDEADDEDQPIPAEVEHDKMVYFGVDNLAGLIGARVVLAPDEDDAEVWHVEQVIGRAPVLDVGVVGTPSIRLYLAADSALIPPSTDTRVNGWTRAAFSRGFGPWSPDAPDGKVRIDRSGIYRVEAFAAWQDSTSGGRSIIVERTDWGGGRHELRRVIAAPTSAGFITSVVAETYYINEGDWIGIKVSQSSGAGLVLRGAADQSRTGFKITWVAPA